jgi:hypothetical protein
VDEEMGIYRGEVTLIMIALMDISADVLAIRTMLEGEEGYGEVSEDDS